MAPTIPQLRRQLWPVSLPEIVIEDGLGRRGDHGPMGQWVHGPMGPWANGAHGPYQANEAHGPRGPGLLTASAPPFLRAIL